MYTKKIDVPNELFEIKKDYTKAIKVNEFGFKRNDIVWVDFSKENDNIDYASRENYKYRDKNGVLGIYVELDEVDKYHKILLIKKNGKVYTFFLKCSDNSLFKTEKQSFEDKCEEPWKLLGYEFRNFIHNSAKLINCVRCNASPGCYVYDRDRISDYIYICRECRHSIDISVTVPNVAQRVYKNLFQGDL